MDLYEAITTLSEAAYDYAEDLSYSRRGFQIDRARTVVDAFLKLLRDEQ